MTVEAVSPGEAESARMLGARNEGEILRNVARVTQARAAAFMGVSPSTVSRMLEDLPKWALLLSALDLQLAPYDSMVVDQTELTALESMSEKYLQMRRQLRLKGV